VTASPRKVTTPPPALLEDVARRFHEHQLGAPLSLLEPLMCHDAEMVLFANMLRPLRGRRTIISTVAVGRASETYRAAVRSFEWLDPQTVLVTGHVRVPGTAPPPRARIQGGSRGQGGLRHSPPSGPPGLDDLARRT
jgi:hypothetical protein